VKRACVIGTVAFVIFAGCQTGPALAFGPYEEWGGHSSVSAMAYLHLPLGVSKAERDRTGSFGFTVNSEYQFSHPPYQRETGAYSTSTTLDLMGLRFGMDGKLSGFDFGGLNALLATTDGAAGK
jgi:hypothetical protein